MKELFKALSKAERQNMSAIFDSLKESCDDGAGYISVISACSGSEVHEQVGAAMMATLTKVEVGYKCVASCEHDRRKQT